MLRGRQATGDAVGANNVSQKGLEDITRLEKWLRDNPASSPGGRVAAENLLLDLKDASGEGLGAC